MIEVIKAEVIPNVGDYDIDIYNAIIIPKDATNGDMILSLYPNLRYTIQNNRIITTIGVASSFDIDWWNAPYEKRGSENG